jgi:hypothetical protein
MIMGSLNATVPLDALAVIAALTLPFHNGRTEA